MKKRTLTVIAILMSVMGLSLLLYPTVSDYLKRQASNRAISDYVASVEPLDDDSYDELLEAARSYNERLAKKSGFSLSLSGAELEEYSSLLDIDSSGVMGYVAVPKADISLPIYHGTGDETLQNGVGHLEGSSLPVGGPGTHAVFSGHTGLPSAKLFTDLDQLVVGDTFTVRVLKETLTYQVDQILVVLPNETDALQIQPGEDYCTLMTCTPYGVNSHRLLVRGHRISAPSQEETPPDTIEQSLDLVPDSTSPSGAGAELWLLIAAVLTLTLLLMTLLWWGQARKRAKRHRENKKQPSQNPPET